MHFYRFHVGDYITHTGHLTPIEDLAYRRILDHYYLHEKPPGGSPQQIARLICLPDHADEVRQVLDEFFTPEGPAPAWRQKRVDTEIEGYAKLRESGRKSANKRWHGEPMGKPKGSQSDGNATPMLTSNQEPITNNQSNRRFAPPTPDDVFQYVAGNGHTIDAQAFCDFYESKNWMVGKNKMKDWKAAARNWVRRDQEEAKGKSMRESTFLRDLTDRSWAD